MDVVVFNDRSAGKRLAVAPGPADGDAGVEEVGDLVIGDNVIGGLSDPDADPAGIDVSAVKDPTVSDLVSSRWMGLGAGDGSFADLNAAAAQIVDQAMHELVMGAASGKLKPVTAGMGDRAVVENAVDSVPRRDRRADADVRL